MDEMAQVETTSVLLPELEHLDDGQRLSLCEVLDRVLNKGAVVVGEVTISVADVDLLYLGLQVVLTSIETARQNCCSQRTVGPVIEVVREASNGLR